MYTMIRVVQARSFWFYWASHVFNCSKKGSLKYSAPKNCRLFGWSPVLILLHWTVARIYSLLHILHVQRGTSFVSHVNILVIFYTGKRRGNSTRPKSLPLMLGRLKRCADQGKPMNFIFTYFSIAISVTDFCRREYLWREKLHIYYLQAF